MPGTLPNTRFAEVTVNSNYTGTSSTMDSGKIQRLNFDGHFYSFTVRYPSLTYAQAKAVSGFIAQQRGPLNNFDITVPEISQPSGGARTIMNLIESQYGTGDLSVIKYNLITLGGVNVNTNTLTYSVSLPSSTYYSPAVHGDWYTIGDYVRFTNHTKAYQIVSSTNPVYTGTSTSGSSYDGTLYDFQGTITVSPNLVVTDLQNWTYDDGAGTITLVYAQLYDVPFRVFLVDTQVSYLAAPGDDTAMSLNLREET